MEPARKNMYMFAIMPPSSLAEEIHRIRLQFSEKYDSRAALKPPVHITLIPSYFALPETEAIVIPAFDKWAADQPSFILELKNYNAFKKEGVIFIDVVKSEELKEFQESLYTLYSQFFELKDRYNFSHPHITIGYRDIPRLIFPKAMQEYLCKPFEASFEVDKFYLWKHNQKFWEVHHTFRMATLQ